eukprot:6407124-Amphidinium_carterae.1
MQSFASPLHWHRSRRKTGTLSSKDGALPPKDRLSPWKIHQSPPSFGTGQTHFVPQIKFELWGQKAGWKK